MVLGTILGSILGSKSHPKLDQKINQILDRFWKDFGSQVGPFWPNFGSKNRSKIKIDFCRKKVMDIRPKSWESKVPGGAQGEPNYHRT